MNFPDKTQLSQFESVHRLAQFTIHINNQRKEYMYINQHWKTKERYR